MQLPLILGIFIHVTLCSETTEDDEEACVRFACDHKLLKTFVRLELSHEAMKQEWNSVKNRYSTPALGKQGGNFVRWGRTSCPENAITVYKGYAGGSWFEATGAASNYLCLPEEPQWTEKTSEDNSINAASARVYGGEYQLDGNANFFGEALHQENVPCAVCESPRSSILMIPGRASCYDGWTVEYTGYLAAGRPNHAAASEYVCLDESPEIIPGGSANQNGVLFYLAEAICGSLKCPPYINGRVMSCVVCSK